MCFVAFAGSFAERELRDIHITCVQVVVVYMRAIEVRPHSLGGVLPWESSGACAARSLASDLFELRVMVVMDSRRGEYIVGCAAIPAVFVIAWSGALKPPDSSALVYTSDVEFGPFKATQTG